MASWEHVLPSATEFHRSSSLAAVVYATFADRVRAVVKRHGHGTQGHGTHGRAAFLFMRCVEVLRLVVAGLSFCHQREKPGDEHNISLEAGDAAGLHIGGRRSLTPQACWGACDTRGNLCMNRGQLGRHRVNKVLSGGT